MARNRRFGCPGFRFVNENTGKAETPEFARRQKRTTQTSLLEPNPVDHPFAKDMERMSEFLDEHPEFADRVAADLSREGVSDVGRHGLTHESVLRCGVLKQLRGESYRELEFALRDSATAQLFARVEGHLAPGKSALQATVGSVSAETWVRIGGVLLEAARSEGVTLARSGRRRPCSRSVAARGLRQCAAYPLLGSAPASVAQSGVQQGPQTGEEDRTDDVLGKPDKCTCYQQADVETLAERPHPLLSFKRRCGVSGMKLKLANSVALCLFALSSSAGSESPSQGGDDPDDVLAEMDPFTQSLAEATPRPTPAAAMSDQRREALERANERINEAEERVEAADRRLRWLEGSEEAARASAEAAALIRERWPEIVERTRSIVGSMSDKQSDAVSEAVLRSQAASDREEASRQVLEALIGDRGDAPFRKGEGELGACTFLKAGETYLQGEVRQPSDVSQQGVPDRMYRARWRGRGRVLGQLRRATKERARGMRCHRRVMRHRRLLSPPGRCRF